MMEPLMSRGEYANIHNIRVTYKNTHNLRLKRKMKCEQYYNAVTRKISRKYMCNTLPNTTISFILCTLYLYYSKLDLKSECPNDVVYKNLICLL